MTVPEYNEKVIKYYNTHLQNYLHHTKDMNTTNLNEKQKIEIQGFETMLHVLSIIYCIKMHDEQINSYLEKCTLLFLEYTEQVYLKKTDILHTPSMFVYNVLIGNISFKEYTNTNNNTFINKLAKWSTIICFWENKKITDNNRMYLVKNFMSPYLLLFTQEKYYSLHLIFESIQTYIINFNYGFEKCSLLLTGFLNYFQKKNHTYSKEEVKSIHFNKFMHEKDDCDEYFKNITSLKDMENFIKWIFSS